MLQSVVYKYIEFLICVALLPAEGFTWSDLFAG